MKLLMHTCCAPCSVYCIDSLRTEGIEPTLYWYNPNIHPYMEYKMRRDTLKNYADSININAIFKKNRVLQARVFYTLMALSIIYLITNFIYDFFIAVKFV